MTLHFALWKTPGTGAFPGPLPGTRPCQVCLVPARHWTFLVPPGTRHSPESPVLPGLKLSVSMDFRCISVSGSSFSGPGRTSVPPLQSLPRPSCSSAALLGHCFCPQACLFQGLLCPSWVMGSPAPVPRSISSQAWPVPGLNNTYNSPAIMSGALMPGASLNGTQDRLPNQLRLWAYLPQVQPSSSWMTPLLAPAISLSFSSCSLTS